MKNIVIIILMICMVIGGMFLFKVNFDYQYHRERMIHYEELLKLINGSRSGVIKLKDLNPFINKISGTHYVISPSFLKKKYPEGISDYTDFYGYDIYVDSSETIVSGSLYKP